MIIDKMERAAKYYYLNENFKTAFEYIESNDLTKLDAGEYKIDGDKAILIIAEDDAREHPGNKLEAHIKYIDIQMVIEGFFGLTWKALEECENIISEYDPEIDAALYSDEADFEIEIRPGTFVVLMPEDAHFPQPPKSKIKKAILKIMM